MRLNEPALWLSLVLTTIASRSYAQDAPAPAPEPSDAAVAPVEPGTGSPVSPEAVAPAAASSEAAAANEAAPAAANDSSELISPEELAAMGFNSTASGAGAVDTSLKISGFLDVTYSGQKSPQTSLFRGVFNRHGSFWVGNVNLYVAKNLTDSIRTMFEVRFTYLPNGTRNQGSAEGAAWNTLSADYNDADRLQRVSAILMQRAYFEWSPFEAANLRVGQYLTPYGIWNVDHGSPAIVSVMRPFIVGAQLFPERQTGLQLFGRVPFATDHAFEYALTLSNGYGPISEYRDLDDNMAFGGHVAWTTDAFGELTIGGSWLIGKDTSAFEQFTLLNGTEPSFREQITQQSDVLALAADIRFKYEGLLVQGELITQQRNYTDVGRVGTNNMVAGGMFIAPPDTFSWGMYGLIGYRFNFLTVMPYFMATSQNIFDLSRMSYTSSIAYIGGLNFRPIDAVALKLEYINALATGPSAPAQPRFHILQAQLAWAF